MLYQLKGNTKGATIAVITQMGATTYTSEKKLAPIAPDTRWQNNTGTKVRHSEFANNLRALQQLRVHAEENILKIKKTLASRASKLQHHEPWQNGRRYGAEGSITVENVEDGEA
jgi:hypothetical protein